MPRARIPVTVPFAPEPLLVRMVGRVCDGEFLAGFYVSWRASEGERCGRCPAAHCTLMRVPGTDVANCIRILARAEAVRHAGHLGVGDRIDDLVASAEAEADRLADLVVASRPAE